MLCLTHKTTDRPRARRAKPRTTYEYKAQQPFALRGGMTQAQIDALPAWSVTDIYTPKMRAVLGYTDSMTQQIHVPDVPRVAHCLCSA